MSAAVYPSDQTRPRISLSNALAPLRVVGGLSASFKADNGKTSIRSLAEHGGYRLKFPDSFSPAVEAVTVNTGGGVAGGDRVRFDIGAGLGANATIATATAERIYRSTGTASEIDVNLTAGPASTLAWLPQASILFSGARLKRRFEVDLAPDARFIMAETTIFGRTASGEIMGNGLLQDVWRVRRDNQLVFAEATRLDGNLTELLARPAIADAARGIALLLCVAPSIADRRDAVRAALEPYDASTGVSAWNGILVVRAIGSRLETLQSALRRAIEALQITSVPHVWSN